MRRCTIFAPDELGVELSEKLKRFPASHCGFGELVETSGTGKGKTFSGALSVQFTLLPLAQVMVTFTV